MNNEFWNSVLVIGSGLLLLGCVGGGPPASSGPVDCPKVCSQVPTSLEQIKAFADCNCDTNSFSSDDGIEGLIPVPPVQSPAVEPLTFCDPNANFYFSCFKTNDGQPFTKDLGKGTQTITLYWQGESFPTGAAAGSMAPDPTQRYCLLTTKYHYVSTDPTFPKESEMEHKHYVNFNLMDSWRTYDGWGTDKYGTEPTHISIYDDGKGNATAQNTKGEVKTGFLYSDPWLNLVKIGNKISGTVAEEYCQNLLTTYGGYT